MKHILYIGGFCLPDKNAAAQRVVANVKIFRDLGCDVTLVGLSRYSKETERFSYDGFDCINLPYPHSFGTWLQMLTSIEQYLPFYTEETAIVIAYNHPAIALKKLLKYNQKRGIVTLSDCTEWYEPQGGWLFKLIKEWDVNQRMKVVHCQLDGIITISRYLDDYYRQRGMKTLLLPPLVDKTDLKWRKRTDIQSDKLTIIYAGSPAGTKDRLDFMIDSLELVSLQGISFVFNIVGITENEYRKVYLNESVKTIPSFVHFLGRIPHNNVIALLQNSDFQIFIRENHLANKAGFPTKFVETISAGTIVLTNPSSNIKDYMIEGVNSFELDISSIDTLVKTLSAPLSLSKDELEKRKESINTNLFDYSSYVSKTKVFLDSLDISA